MSDETEVDDRGSASRDLLGLLLRNPVLLAGAYLWAVTLAPVLGVAAGHVLRGGLPARPLVGGGFALLTLGALVASRLGPPRPEVARALGIWGVLGGALLSLVLVPEVVDVAHLDALRGALSALGFVLYAMSWGIEERTRRPEDDPRADLDARFEPREPPTRASLVVAGIGIATAGLLVFSAFQVHDVPRGSLAHAVAGLASVAVVSASAEIATTRPKDAPVSAASRLRRAATAIVLLTALVVAGVGAVLLAR